MAGIDLDVMARWLRQADEDSSSSGMWPWLLRAEVAARHEITGRTVSAAAH